MRLSYPLLALLAMTPILTSAQVEMEPNNAWNQNNPATIGTPMSGSIGTCGPTDNSSDYYQLTVPANGVVKIRTNMANNGVGSTAGIRLYNASVVQISTFNLTTGTNGTFALDSALIDCMGTGTFYLEFMPASSGCINYTFNYSVISPVHEADMEPNFAWNSVNTDTIPVNTPASGQLNFDQNDDNSDFFILDLDDDGVLNVHVSAEHSGSSANDSLTLRLYNVSVVLMKTWRVPVGANSAPVLSDRSLTCLGREQRYFLQFQSDVCGASYQFSYDVTPPVFGDDAEENDAWNSSNTDTVAVGVLTEGRLFFNNDDNSDHFILELDEDGVLNVHVEAEHVSSENEDSITVRLYNSSVVLLETWRAPIGANSVAVLSDHTMPCLGREVRYFLRFASDACGTSYRFSYDVTPPLYGDDIEENDSWNSVNTDTVMVNTVVEGRLNFLNDDNSDYFTLELDDDGELNLHVRAEHVGALANDSLIVRLFNSSVVLMNTWRLPIGVNSTSVLSERSMTCLGREQRYFLQFQSEACGTSYQFSYDVTPPLFADDLEENDAWNSTNTGTIDLNSGSVEGRLAFTYDDNTDYYRIVLDSPGTITIQSRAERSGATGTYDLKLYNTSVVLLDTHTFPVGGGSSVASGMWTSDPLAAGNYFLQASNAACGTSYSFDCYDDDDDGTCNGADVCPGVPEPGTPCDDGLANTTNDMWTESCICAGETITGIPDHSKHDELLVWPNPADGDVLYLNKRVIGQVSNSLGQVVAHLKNSNSVSISDLAPGLYFLGTSDGKVVRFVRR
ncbi:MAG: hypothetical protein R2815_04590 [Flavobacteriales bacterium]